MAPELETENEVVEHVAERGKPSLMSVCIEICCADSLCSVGGGVCVFLGSQEKLPQKDLEFLA